MDPGDPQPHPSEGEVGQGATPVGAGATGESRRDSETVLTPGQESVDTLDKGALSPLTGSYLLIILAEPHSEEDREIIIKRLTKGLRSWDLDGTHVDLSCELLNLANAAPESDIARNGEKLVQWASENLVVEVLIHCQVNTIMQCMKNLLSSFTRHRHIIHAGYTFQGSGSWILQDGTFSFADFVELWDEPEVHRILGAYRGDISLSIHCAEENGWTDDRLGRESFSKLCQVCMNPEEKISGHSSGIISFVDYISKLVQPASLKEILEPSDIVGNIRFSHPTLYVFPGGQGDAALFGVNGFNMLIDGGFSRRSCFWEFTRHLDRLDAVLLTRVNNNAVGGLDSLMNRKQMSQVYPQIGHFFGNVMERKHPESEESKAGDLSVSLTETGQRILDNLRNINLRPQHCFRDHTIDPINLYHKVGHGKLDMYVLNPAKDSREVREFLSKWNTNCTSFVQAKMSVKVEGKEMNYPVLNLVSICALVVWQPDNPREPITRILFPGSTPQQKIFEALGKLKHLEFLKYPICSAKTIAASHKSRSKSERIVSEARAQLRTGDAGSESSKVSRAPSESRVPSSRYSSSLYAGVKSKITTTSQRSDSSSTIQTAEEKEKEMKERRGRERSREKKKVISSKDKGVTDNKALEEKKASVAKSRVDTGLKSTTRSRSKSKTAPKSKTDTEKKSEVTSPPPEVDASSSATKELNALKKSSSASKYGIGVSLAGRKVAGKPIAGKTSPPPATPPKSAKEATNRKVIESKVTSSTTATTTAISKRVAEKTKESKELKTTTAKPPPAPKPKTSSAPTRPSTASSGNNKKNLGSNNAVPVRRPNSGTKATAAAAAVAVGVSVAAAGIAAAATSSDQEEKQVEKKEADTTEMEESMEKDSIDEEIVKAETNGFGLAASVPVTESSSELSSLEHVIDYEVDQEHEHIDRNGHDHGSRPGTELSEVSGSEEIETVESAANKPESETHTITEHEHDHDHEGGYEEEDEYLVIEKDESAGGDEIHGLEAGKSGESYYEEKEVGEEKDLGKGEQGEGEIPEPERTRRSFDAGAPMHDDEDESYPEIVKTGSASEVKMPELDVDEGEESKIGITGSALCLEKSLSPEPTGTKGEEVQEEIKTEQQQRRPSSKESCEEGPASPAPSPDNKDELNEPMKTLEDEEGPHSPSPSPEHIDKKSKGIETESHFEKKSGEDDHILKTEDIITMESTSAAATHTGAEELFEKEGIVCEDKKETLMEALKDDIVFEVLKHEEQMEQKKAAMESERGLEVSSPLLEKENVAEQKAVDFVDKNEGKGPAGSQVNLLQEEESNTEEPLNEKVLEQGQEQEVSPSLVPEVSKSEQIPLMEGVDTEELSHNKEKVDDSLSPGKSERDEPTEGENENESKEAASKNDEQPSKTELGSESDTAENHSRRGSHEGKLSVGSISPAKSMEEIKEGDDDKHSVKSESHEEALMCSVSPGGRSTEHLEASSLKTGEDDKHSHGSLLSPTRSGEEKTDGNVEEDDQDRHSQRSVSPTGSVQERKSSVLLSKSPEQGQIEQHSAERKHSIESVSSEKHSELPRDDEKVETEKASPCSGTEGEPSTEHFDLIIGSSSDKEIHSTDIQTTLVAKSRTEEKPEESSVMTLKSENKMDESESSPAKVVETEPSQSEEGRPSSTEIEFDTEILPFEALALAQSGERLITQTKKEEVDAIITSASSVPVDEKEEAKVVKESAEGEDESIIAKTDDKEVPDLIAEVETEAEEIKNEKEFKENDFSMGQKSELSLVDDVEASASAVFSPGDSIRTEELDLALEEHRRRLSAANSQGVDIFTGNNSEDKVEIETSRESQFGSVNEEEGMEDIEDEEEGDIPPEQKLHFKTDDEVMEEEAQTPLVPPQGDFVKEKSSEHEKNIEVKEERPIIPSAIPSSKFPRGSKEVVRTPDEVADLPMHEEVDPGIYKDDDEGKQQGGKDEKPVEEDVQEELPSEDQFGQSSGTTKSATYITSTSLTTTHTTKDEESPAPEFDSEKLGKSEDGEEVDQQFPKDEGMAMSIVEKIDAAVSPVLESLLTKSVEKSLEEPGAIRGESDKYFTETATAEEQAQDKNQAMVTGPELTESQPKELEHDIPEKQSGSDPEEVLKEDEESEKAQGGSLRLEQLGMLKSATATTSVVITPSTPPVILPQEEDNFHYGRKAEEVGQTEDESRPTVSGDYEDDKPMKGDNDQDKALAKDSLPSKEDIPIKIGEERSEESSTSSVQTAVATASLLSNEEKAGDDYQSPKKLFFLPRDEDDDEEEEMDEGNDDNEDHVLDDVQNGIPHAIEAGLINAANTAGAAVVHQNMPVSHEIKFEPGHETEPGLGSSPKADETQKGSSSFESQTVPKTDLHLDKQITGSISSSKEKLSEDVEALEATHTDAKKSDPIQAEGPSPTPGLQHHKECYLDLKHIGKSQEGEGDLDSSQKESYVSETDQMKLEEAQSPRAKVEFASLESEEVIKQGGSGVESIPINVSSSPPSSLLLETAESAVSSCLETATETIRVAESALEEVEEKVDDLLKEKEPETFTEKDNAPLQGSPSCVAGLEDKICEAMHQSGKKGCEHHIDKDEDDDNQGPGVVEELCVKTVAPKPVIPDTFYEEKEGQPMQKEESIHIVIKKELKAEPGTGELRMKIDESVVDSSVISSLERQIISSVEDQEESEGKPSGKEIVKDDIHEESSEPGKEGNFSKEKPRGVDFEETSAPQEFVPSGTSNLLLVEEEEQQKTEVIKKRKVLSDYLGTMKEARGVFVNLLKIARSGAVLSSAVDECRMNAQEAIRAHLEAAEDFYYRPVQREPDVDMDSPEPEGYITVYENLEQMASAGADLFTGLIEKVEKEAEEKARREAEGETEPEPPEEEEDTVEGHPVEERRSSAELAVTAALQHLHETFKTMQTMGSSPKHSSSAAARRMRCPHHDHEHHHHHHMHLPTDHDEEESSAASSAIFSSGGASTSPHLSTSGGECTLKSPEDENERSEGETMRGSLASFTESGVASQSEGDDVTPVKSHITPSQEALEPEGQEEQKSDGEELSPKSKSDASTVMTSSYIEQKMEKNETVSDPVEETASHKTEEKAETESREKTQESSGHISSENVVKTSSIVETSSKKDEEFVSRYEDSSAHFYKEELGFADGNFRRSSSVDPSEEIKTAAEPKLSRTASEAEGSSYYGKDFEFKHKAEDTILEHSQTLSDMGYQSHKEEMETFTKATEEWSESKKHETIAETLSQGKEFSTLKEDVSSSGPFSFVATTELKKETTSDQIPPEMVTSVHPELPKQYHPTTLPQFQEEEQYSSGDFTDSQPSSIPPQHGETDEEIHNFDIPDSTTKKTTTTVTSGDVDNGNYSTTTTTNVNLITKDDGTVLTQSVSTTAHVEQRDNGNLNTSRVEEEVRTTSSSSTSATSTSGVDVLKEWGKPLGLPVVYTEGENGASGGVPGTPKKSASKTETPGKSSSSKRTSSRRTSRHSPIYVDLAYVPHHGNSHYCDSEFFRMVRARYYVFSGIEPSRDVFEGLLQGKQQWEDKNLETTIIPTYDTDTLGYWVVDSEKELAEAKIDLAPSASRCTINLQDHETSCAAYRLEF